MHYLIDGYNWLFRTPKSPKNLEEKRRQFVKDVHSLVASKNCLVTIVFDSSDPSREISSKGNFDFLEIIFTPKKQTADEYIEQLVENSSKPHLISVVTLDRELRNKCKLRGANILSFKEFFDLFNKQTTKKIEKIEIKESPNQIQRLLKIFEKKLQDESS